MSILLKLTQLLVADIWVHSWLCPNWGCGCSLLTAHPSCPVRLIYTLLDVFSLMKFPPRLGSTQESKRRKAARCESTPKAFSWGWGVMLSKHPMVFFLQSDPFSWHPGVRPRVSGPPGTSTPCVLAPSSSIGHKELILAINGISTANGDGLTSYFQNEHIHTLGGVDRPEGFGSYRVTAIDTEFIHGGRNFGHCLKGCLSAARSHGGLDWRECVEGLPINRLLYGFCGGSPTPTPAPRPQPSTLLGLG